jgi:hypothetical protein
VLLPYNFFANHLIASAITSVGFKAITKGSGGMGSS